MSLNVEGIQSTCEAGENLHGFGEIRSLEIFEEGVDHYLKDWGTKGYAELALKRS